jgi:hypothetical protein
MEQLPNIVRERLKPAAGRDHPDPDLLSAFAEQVLPERERSRVLLHLSNCATCRDVLAVALPATETPSVTLDTAHPVPWFRWPILRWGAAAACVVIVGSAVLMKRDVFMARTPQTASVSSDSAPSEYLKHEQAAEATVESSPTRSRQTDSLQEPSVESLTAHLRVKNQKEKEAEAQNKANTRWESKLPARVPMSAAAAQSVPAPSETTATKFDHGFALAGNARTAVGGLDSGVRADQALKVAPGTPPRDEKAKKLQFEARNVPVTGLAKAAKPNESAQVQGAAPSFDEYALTADSSEKREAPGKAKAATSNVMLDSAEAAGQAAAPAIVSETVANERGRTAKVGSAFSRPSPVSRWTISSDGQLQHSVDSGISWQPVVVAEKASFRALSANGPDVWVGGASGLLYHSTDAGAHWNQVKPTSSDATLTADIAAIEFTDLRRGKITTATGDSWLTEDAGQTWRKQP